MFRKLKQLVSFYDKKFFAWLEGKSSTRSKRDRQTSEDTNTWSRESNRRMVSPSNAIQIPDPWD
jgi:hypothetical protein